MKKVIGIVLILIMAAASLSALEFTVGPKVMLGDMSYNGDGFPGDNKMSLFFAGGAFANIQLTSLIGIQPEIYLNYTSLKYDFAGNEIVIHYPVLSIPIYARFNFDVANIGVYALAGVRFDLNISDESKVKTNGSSGTGDISDFNFIVLGAAGGAGVSLPIGPGVLDAGLGIFYGFTEFSDGLDASYWDIDVQVGYGFSL